MDNDNGDDIDEKAYITPICGELATKEEVNKVDLEDVKGRSIIFKTWFWYKAYCGWQLIVIKIPRTSNLVSTDF